MVAKHASQPNRNRWRPHTQKVRQSIHQPGKHFYEHVTFPLEIQAAKWKVHEQGDITLTAYNKVDGSEVLHQLIW